jgi:hypothetical protein
LREPLSSARRCGPALPFSIVLLTFIGYLGAQHAGTTGRAAILEATDAGLFGVVIMGGEDTAALVPE